MNFNHPQAPEPIEKWQGEYKAIHDGPQCSQRDPFIRSFEDVGTEDCLYLNVYVPHAVILKRFFSLLKIERDFH